MDVCICLLNVFIGLILVIIGFKFYNPFQNDKTLRKERIWYRKFGLLFKITGPIMLVVSIIKLLENTFFH